MGVDAIPKDGKDHPPFGKKGVQDKENQGEESIDRYPMKMENITTIKWTTHEK